MTREEAKRLGYEYYIDDEPSGCCKVDGTCNDCVFIDVCGELEDVMRDNLLINTEDGDIWFEQVLKYDGTNLQEIKRFAPEAKCSLKIFDEKDYRASMGDLSKYIGQEVLVVEFEDFITFVPKEHYLARQTSYWHPGDSSLSEMLLFHSYDEKDLLSEKMHTFDSFIKMARRYALESCAKYAMNFLGAENVAEILAKRDMK